MTGLSNGNAYTYDANGSMVTRMEDGVMTTFSYNAENKLTSVAQDGPQTQSFGYDSLDRITSAAATGGTDGLYNETYNYDRLPATWLARQEIPTPMEIPPTRTR